MYRYENDINHETFIKFPRDLVLSGTWATLPSAARAVYPVYMAFMNRKTGLSFPDERSVAALAGVTEKTVRVGRNALADAIPGLTAQRYVTRRGRRSWRLHFTKEPRGRNSWRPFFKSVLHGGHWGNYEVCTPSAHALFPVMLVFGYYDHDAANETADDYTRFGEHSFEYCEAERSVLLEHSGLSRNSITGAMDSLQKAFLIEGDGDRWKIYRKPRRRFPAKNMNKLIQKRGL